MSFQQDLIDELQAEMTARLQFIHAHAGAIAETETMAEALVALGINAQPVGCHQPHTRKVDLWVGAYFGTPDALIEAISSLGWDIARCDHSSTRGYAELHFTDFDVPLVVPHATGGAIHAALLGEREVDIELIPFTLQPAQEAAHV